MKVNAFDLFLRQKRFDLIFKYKIFKNLKDFMERANIVKVHKAIITVDYTNDKD